MEKKERDFLSTIRRLVRSIQKCFNYYYVNICVCVVFVVCVSFLSVQRLFFTVAESCIFLNSKCNTRRKMGLMN